MENKYDKRRPWISRRTYDAMLIRRITYSKSEFSNFQEAKKSHLLWLKQCLSVLEPGDDIISFFSSPLSQLCQGRTLWRIDLFLLYVHIQRNPCSCSFSCYCLWESNWISNKRRPWISALPESRKIQYGPRHLFEYIQYSCPWANNSVEAVVYRGRKSSNWPLMQEQLVVSGGRCPVDSEWCPVGIG